MKKFNDPIEKGLGRFREMWSASSLGERTLFVVAVAAAVLAMKYVVVPKLAESFAAVAKMLG
ncbi:hypothetical protein DBR23_17680 [Acidovorax sp. HMWF018]|uniref:hypothetical protein n=1 Tax=Acidovorax sp. HMWF018 TaxID=2056855 RepID=UPI000D3D333A|nr:hypothetical protein [Acidovorax sp. HMWF018]PTT37394.1 hypothetical protein DBR23_17680 [Acidovorax sp. HMWF018]